MKVAVSILKCFESEEETIVKINATDADYLHVDVLDGSFTQGSATHYEYLHESKKPLNVHLMVSRPFDYISTYANFKAESVTIQAELEDDLNALLDYIKSLNMKCGLALSPETPVDRVEPYLSKLDEVLVLSVYPGKGGQGLVEEVLYKIDELADLRESGGYKYSIFVDGGIRDTTIKKVQRADAVVSGTYIVEADDYQERIDKLRL